MHLNENLSISQQSKQGRSLFYQVLFCYFYPPYSPLNKTRILIIIKTSVSFHLVRYMEFPHPFLHHTPLPKG